MKNLINNYNEIISIKKCDMDKFFVEFGHRHNEKKFTVEFRFIDNSTFNKDFKNEDEIINFMEKEYYILKCECLELSINEAKKIQKDNARLKLLFDSEFCRCPKCEEYKRSGFGCLCENEEEI